MLFIYIKENVKLCHFISLMCDKLHLSDVGHLQTHNFGAVLKNLCERFSRFCFPLVQFRFEIQFSVLLVSWLSFVAVCFEIAPKKKSHFVRSGG